MKRLEGRKAKWRKWASSVVYAYGMITFVWPVRAFAAIAAGGALPWDQPLTTLQTDLQGPVAHAITTAIRRRGRRRFCSKPVTLHLLADAAAIPQIL